MPSRTIAGAAVTPGPTRPTPGDGGATTSYVVVYSDTSRTDSAVSALSEARPGLEGETYTLSSLDIYLRLRGDLAAGGRLPDLYLVSDPPRTLSLAAEGVLVNLVPPELRAVLPAEARAPLLAHHWTALTLVTSSLTTLTVQVDNWWDLTRPELRGRVVLPDPTLDERTLYWLTQMAQYDDEMALAYRHAFGRDIALDPACPSVGWQWALELMRNQPQLVVSDAQVAALVGDPASPQGYVGLCGSEQWDKAARGSLALAPLLDAQPTAGIRWWSYLAAVAGSRAGVPADGTVALEVVRWLMGDATGGGGYAVWHKTGFYSARSDVPDPQGAPPSAALANRLWELDSAYVSAHLAAMRDLLAPYVGHAVGGR